MNTLDVFESFQATKNIDELWNTLRLQLDDFGVTSMFYGFTHSVKHSEDVGIIESLWHKTDHPKKYREYFDDKFYINDDLGAVHCMYETTPFVWDDPENWIHATPQQERLMKKSYEFDMGIGVSIPIRFNQYGIGGLGLCTGEVDGQEFNKIWTSYSEEISGICHIFDEIARSEQMNCIYPLTPREQEVLCWLCSGKNIKVIADILGTSPSTVDKQIRSARKKLNARNNEQAVTKALILGLIHP